MLKAVILFIVGALSILLSSAHANLIDRKGPIFTMSDIPAQRDLLKAYFAYNAERLPLLEARHRYYEPRYSLMSEDAFDVFRSRTLRHTPNLDFSLAFQNHNMGFENRERQNDQYGYCLGVTTTLRKMNLLAFYDPNNTHGAVVPNRDTDPNAWLAYYEKLVDTIMRNRPAIIPYFSNLHEFSGTPGIKEYMIRHVLNEWGSHNATLYSGVMQMLHGTKRTFTKREAKHLYSDLRKRLDRGYPPRVFLSKKNPEGKMFGPQYIHVMQVFDLTPMQDDGTYRIGVWHINVTWDKATYYIEIKPDGRAFMEWRDLGELDIVPWDDAEIAEMGSHLKPFCKDNAELCQ